jgi:hypothetical protein
LLIHNFHKKAFIAISEKESHHACQREKREAGDEMEDIPDNALCFDFHPCHNPDDVEPAHAASGKVQLLQADDAILPEHQKGWPGEAHNTHRARSWQGHVFGTEWAEGPIVMV